MVFSVRYDLYALVSTAEETMKTLERIRGSDDDNSEATHRWMGEEQIAREARESVCMRTSNIRTFELIRS